MRGTRVLLIHVLLLGCGASVETQPPSGTGGAGATSSTSGSTTTGGSTAMTTSSSDGGPPCVLDADCPAGPNECLLPWCSLGTCTIVPAPSDTICNGVCQCGPMGTCGGGACASDADCAPPEPCWTATCTICSQCLFEPLAQGTPAPGDIAGDCVVPICDGAGLAVVVPDDGDLPDDGDPCTVDLCVNGVPAHTPLCPPGQICDQGMCSTPCIADADCPSPVQPCLLASCKNGVCGVKPADVTAPCGTCHCDGNGACAGPSCITDAICPAAPNACVLSKCFGCEQCGFFNVAAGTVVPGPKGDCHTRKCDGAGQVVVTVDDADVPDDADPCTVDLCTNGVPGHTPLCPAPQTCNQGVCSP